MSILLMAVRLAHSERWGIELVMHHYNQVCELDETRAYSDCFVIGGEFASSLAYVLTYKILNDVEKRDPRDECLRKGDGEAQEGQEDPHRRRVEGKVVRINPSEEALLVDLGVLEKSAEQPQRLDDL